MKKHIMSKLLSILLAIAMVFTSVQPITVNAANEQVTVDLSDVSSGFPTLHLEVGKTYDVTVTGATIKEPWSSPNSNVISMSNNSMYSFTVEAKHPGTVTLTNNDDVSGDICVIVITVDNSYNTTEYDENGYPVFEFVYGESYAASDLVAGAINTMYTTMSAGYASSEEYSWFEYTSDANSNGLYKVGSGFLNSGNSVPYTVSGLNYSSNNIKGFYMTVRIVGIDPTMSFDSDSVTKTVGDANFTNAFTTDSGGTKTFSSSNTSVATVSSTGSVTIKGAGTTTITCNVASSSIYNAGSKSYTLTVGKKTSNLILKDTDETYNGRPLYTWTYGESHSISEVLSEESEYDSVLTMRGVDAPDSLCFDGNDTDCLTVTNITSIGTYNGEDGIAMVQISSPETDDYSNGIVYFYVRLDKATPNLKLKETDETANISTGNGLAEVPVFRLLKGQTYTAKDFLDLSGSDFDENADFCIYASFGGDEQLLGIDASFESMTPPMTGESLFDIYVWCSETDTYKSGESGYLKVIVENPKPKLSFAEDSVTKTYGEGKFTNTLTTDSDGDVTYVSSNTDVAEIDETTGEVTIVGAGTAVISATVCETENYSSATVDYTLTVNKAENIVQFAESSITKSYGTTDFVNPLLSKVMNHGEITYTSSDNSIATVSEDGTVSIVGVGRVTITAICAESSNNTESICSYELIVTKQELAAPQLTAVNETIKGKRDGRIEGLSTEMEYSTDGINYTKVTDASMLFAPGTYYVQYSVTDVAEPFGYTEVVIAEGRMLTVTFKSEGSEDIVKEVEYNATLSDIPEVPAKEGYDKTSPYWDVTDFTDIKSDMIVNAVYTINTYSVTFVADGETMATETVEWGNSLHDIPAIPAKEGYDQTAPTWDITDFSNIMSDLTVNAIYTKNSYSISQENSVTAPEGVNVTLVSGTEAGYGDVFTFEVDVEDGYSMTDDFKVLVNGEEVEPDEEGGNSYSVIVSGDIAIEVVGVADITAPEVEITVGSNIWKSMLNKITFGIFFKDTQEVVITSTDLGSGVKDVKYYLAEEPIAESEISSIIGWIDYSNPISISPNNQYVIYAKVTDNAGNVTIVSSDGIVLNNIAPTITGVEDGGSYYGDMDFNVEATGLLKVMIDGTEVELSEDGYTIPADNLQHTIILEDKSGNTTSYTVTVYKYYTVVFKADDVVVEERTVGYGNGISDMPEIPSKEGYTQVAPVWDVEDIVSVADDMVVNAVYTADTYQVVTSDTESNEGYVIEAVGNSNITYGEDYTFIVKIEEGYEKGDDFSVSVDGKVLQANEDGSYTVKNVTGDLKIEVKGIKKIENSGTGEPIQDGSTVLLGNYYYRILSKAKKTCQVTGIKNTNLTSITVYNKVAFSGVEYKVVSVKANAFEGYDKATSVTIGKNVKVIGKYAFKNCKNIKKVTVKSLGLRRIKAGAFSGCRKLKSVVIKSKNLKTVGKNAFKNISKKAVIRVPARKYAKYIKILSGKGLAKTVKIKK